MITIIIILVLFAVVWFTKSIWAEFIIKMFRKHPSVRDIKTSNTTLFAPQGVTRSFVVAIDIVENGDGTVELSVAKLKQKEV